MSKTSIKIDKHSLYARGGGYIWRPVGLDLGEFQTIFTLGDSVTVSHSGGITASISGNGRKERWYSHGCYIDIHNGMKIIPSEKLWRVNNVY